MNNFSKSVSSRFMTQGLIGSVFLVGLIAQPVKAEKSLPSHQIIVANKQAGELSIKGSVTDATTDEPLVGCSILVKGSNRGVNTDVNGKFTISADEKAVLVVSYVGYNKQEIAVAGRANIQIKMVANSAALEQVIVIGYGSTTQKDVTGSMKSIKEGAFNKGIINSPEQLLQGKVAGVNVTSASGEPGGTQSITVRGPGGVRTGSTPLFVVDGLALDNSSTGGATNPLNYLNPQDIASIDVLKDASATAIYGARGANGVILITTKKGKAGTSTLTYNVDYGISTMARPLSVFSADEYRKQVVAVGGVLEDLKASTDWQKEISRTAITQNHNLSFGGGNEKLTYFGSFGIQNQEGIIKNSQLNRYSGRINATQKLLQDRLTVDVNLSASQTYNERPPIGAVLGGAIATNPTYPAYNSDGSIYLYQSGTNPLLSLKLEQDATTITRIVGNISPSLKIIDGLVYKLNFGIDNSSSARDLRSAANAVPLQDGRLETINTYNNNKLVENYLTYSKTLAAHSFSALVGHSYQKIFLQGRAYSINKFPISDIDPIYNPGLGQDLTLANNKPSGYALINELQSFFTRVNYQYKDKYLVTATLRADGSSKFGKNNKYGYFPSFSLGWRLSEEAFLKNTAISDLKLRAGWGRTGNQEIPSKITQARFTSVVSSTTSYPLSESNTSPAGTSYTRLANPTIQWEQSTQTDLGLDFSFWKGALSGTIDVFRKVSGDILLEVIPSDPVQPAGTYWTNVSNMTITNKGLELDLSYKHNASNGLSYEIGGNITFIDNVVKNSPYSVIPSGSASGSGLTSATINGYVNGAPIGAFFLKEFTGFDDKGVSTYRDVDGDGQVTDKDRIVAGSALPNKQFNFFGKIAYKGFDLAVNFNGVSGNKIYDNTANANFYKLRLSKGINTTPEAIAFAQESINNAAPVSTRFLKDGAFLRLNNLSLGYNLNPQSIGLKDWVRSIRLSVTGQNLLVVTAYDGYDPEVNTDRTINGITSYGIDYLSYPKARTVMFGLNVTF